MTRDDTMKLLQECGFGTLMDHPILTENMMRFAALVAAAEKELIAQWVEGWGSDLTIKEIVEGIRTDGNGATRPLKYVTREEPL
jgi:hypothetical protein